MLQMNNLKKEKILKIRILKLKTVKYYSMIIRVPKYKVKNI